MKPETWKPDLATRFHVSENGQWVKFSAYEELEKERDRWERVAKYEMNRAAEGQPE